MKLNKPYTNAQYADLAVYCNENSLIIEDKGDYLEAANPPEPSDEEKKAQVRSVRNQYLKEYIDDRAKSPFMWDEVPEEEKALIGEYRKYLMDYPETEGWYEHSPMTFEEWKQTSSTTTEGLEENTIEEGGE